MKFVIATIVFIVFLLLLLIVCDCTSDNDPDYQDCFDTCRKISECSEDDNDECFDNCNIDISNSERWQCKVNCDVSNVCYSYEYCIVDCNQIY